MQNEKEVPAAPHITAASPAAPPLCTGIWQEIERERIEACRRLYLKYKGRRHARIESEMRSLGYARFCRRILYTRKERGRTIPGWIERYGWRGQVRSENGEVSGAEGEAKNETPGTAIDPHVAPQTANPPTSAHLFRSWLREVSPRMNWDWRHIRYICKHLERVTTGECKRLMIFVPPRHGKSELVTVRYAAWRMKQDPSMNIIIGSYNQRLADRFSRKIKRVLSEDHALSAGNAGALARKAGSSGLTNDIDPDDNNTQRPTVAKNSGGAREGACAPAGESDSPCPFPFVSSKPKNSEAEWETTHGGGLRAVGVGGGVTGFGAQLIIVDDPVKSRSEAESKTFRDNVYEWFNDDIYTRLEPGGSIVLIQTRWHEDDLAGRLLREMEEGGEKWDVVDLPAIAEGVLESRETGEGEMVKKREDHNRPVSLSADVPDPLGRPPGEPLCPDRYDAAALERVRTKIGSYAFASLYQQRPAPADGEIFKRQWFEQIAAAAPTGLRWTRGYDLAVSTRTTADYTASFRVAFDREGNMYIDGGVRKRMEFPEQKRFIREKIESERDTAHGIELALHGHAMMQELRRAAQIRGRPFRGVRVTGDKVSRALVWSPLAEEGKVILVRGPWIRDFLDELAAFPAGAHDDQIDAVSIAVQMQTRQNRGLFFF